MIPLIPTLALALVSLTCSAFVIIRTMLSILSPRTFSRRLYPLHHCPPSSRALPPADKSYIWLALCDLSALGVFVWEAFAQRSGGFSAHPSIGATSRLWLALTLRQTCFLIVSALILIHVRLRKSVSFGTAHWLLWVPLVFLVAVSTGIVIAGTSAGRIFRVGYITYSSVIAVMNTIMFGCLVGTLIIIRRSIENFHKAQQQPSNESADMMIDAIREGSAWIASTTSSRQRQDAASTRTRHTSQSGSPLPSRFPFWPPPGAHPYSSLPQTPSHDSPHRDFEPFRRRAQSLRAAALTLSSGNSWITSSLGTHPTLSAWSFPTTTTTTSSRPAITSTTQERTTSAPVLLSQTEKGSQPSATPPVIEISVLRILAWFAGVWVPLLFALPYIVQLDNGESASSILLVISVTISSPILALNLLLRHPIPIPSGVFNAPPHRPREPTHPIVPRRPYYYSYAPKQVTGPSSDHHDNLKRLLGPAPNKLSLLPSNDSDMKTPPPPPRWPSEVHVLPAKRRHSSHYAQSYRHAYDRAARREGEPTSSTRHTRSVSVPFPTRTHDVSAELNMPI